jgi:PIN domain nuclease of toxin-antitoxin system
LLLDTHVFLWWRTNHRSLRKTAREAIATADLVFVSAASAWEVAIKTSLGRLTLPDSMAAGVTASGFVRLDIGFSHAERAGALPRHHGDPFDRMLVAQALVEGLTLVTHDATLSAYGVPLLPT